MSLGPHELLEQLNDAAAWRGLTAPTLTACRQIRKTVVIRAVAQSLDPAAFSKEGSSGRAARFSDLPKALFCPGSMLYFRCRTHTALAGPRLNGCLKSRRLRISKTGANWLRV